MSLWQKISEHLDNHGFDQNYLHSLLKFIDALEIELPRIIDNLLLLLPALNRLINHYSGFDFNIPIPKWEAICRELKNSPALQQMLAETNKKGKMPLRKKYVSNPVYVAIWQRPDSPSGQRTYYMLLAHFLIAVAILRGRMAEQAHLNLSEQEQDNFNGNIIASLLAVRNLSLPKNLATLEAFNDLNIAPDDLLEILDGSSKKFAPLKVILSYLLRLKKRPHRKEHGNQETSEPEAKRNPRNYLPANKSEIHSNLDPEQEEGIGVYDLLQLPAVEESESNRIEELGCSPTEGYSGLEIVSQKVKEKDNKEVKSPAQKVQVKWKIKAHLAMLN
jgi:hypothetical protein